MSAGTAIYGGLAAAATTVGAACVVGFALTLTTFGPYHIDNAASARNPQTDVAGLAILTLFVAAAARERRQLALRLERARRMEALRLPAGGIAHNFKDILAAVDGYAELAGDLLTADSPARKPLHPALSDLLVEAAQDVHGKSTIMQRAGQFPNPTARDFLKSDDAIRYFRSVKSSLYRTLPLWLASVTDGMLLLIIPAVRSIPMIYR
jgi:signal transduction histidine kinase